MKTHNFYKVLFNLDLYQYQEIPQAIVSYEKRFERSLLTEIRRFQRELNWDEMWTLEDVYKRLEAGWKFWVIRPKNQIKGWAWLAPDGEMKNLYVSKWLRNQGWGKYLYLQCMNEALDRDYPQVYARVDVWNEPAKHCIENVMEFVNCPSSVELVTENY